MDAFDLYKTGNINLAPSSVGEKFGLATAL